MNFKRLLFAGMISGVVFNLLGITSAVVFNLGETFARMGWEPQAVTGFLHLGMRFVLGIVAVFLYAAIRPRFGPGPNTAIIVGVTIWIVGYLLPGILMTELGIFGLSQGILLEVWGIVEASLATMAGAWFYKE